MAKKKKEEKKEEKKPNKARDSITTFVRNMFKKKASVSNEVVIAAVLVKWPKSKIQGTHISFYKNKFRKEGMEIPKAVRKKKEVEEKKGKKSKKAS